MVKKIPRTIYKHPKLFLSLLWVVCIAVWISTFVLTTESLSYILLLRMIAVLIGTAAFLGLLVNVGKEEKINNKIYFSTQFLSIIFAVIFLLLNNLYENMSGVIDYSTLSNLGLYILVAGLMNILLFFRSLNLIIKRRRFDLIFSLNILLSAYPLFSMFMLIFLLGIGLGPPS